MLTPLRPSTQKLIYQMRKTKLTGAFHSKKGKRRVKKVLKKKADISRSRKLIIRRDIINNKPIKDNKKRKQMKIHKTRTRVKLNKIRINSQHNKSNSKRMSTVQLN